MEIGLHCTCGDYPAVSLSNLKVPSFDESLWRNSPGMTWSDVAVIIDKELVSRLLPQVHLPSN